MELTEKAKRIKAIITNQNSRFVSVKFRKTDDTIREITFNPKNVKGLDTDKSVGPQHVYRCVENCNQQWKSFRLDSVMEIKCGGQKEVFN